MTHTGQIEIIDLTLRTEGLEQIEDDFEELAKCFGGDQTAAEDTPLVEMQLFTAYAFDFTSAGIHPLNFLPELERKPTDSDRFVQRIEAMRKCFRERPIKMLSFLRRNFMTPKSAFPLWKYTRSLVPRRQGGEEPDHVAVDYQALKWNWRRICTNRKDRIERERGDPATGLLTAVWWVERLDKNLKAFNQLGTGQMINHSFDATYECVAPRTVGMATKLDGDGRHVKTRKILYRKERAFNDLCKLNVIFVTLVHDPSPILWATAQQVDDRTK